MEKELDKRRPGRPAMFYRPFLVELHPVMMDECQDLADLNGWPRVKVIREAVAEYLDSMRSCLKKKK